MAWIDKTKRSGKHLIRWRDLAGKLQSTTARTYENAERIKRKIEDTIDGGRDYKPEVTGLETDIETVTEAYIDHRRQRLRPRTLVRYAENLDLFVRFLRTRQAKGKLSVMMLSRPLLEDYYSWLLKPENGLHKRARGADTARKIAEVTQLCWEWAEASERWPEIPRPRKIEMVRSEAEAVVAPTWAEADACVNACKGWHKQLATFLRYTGLRVGETMLLLWSDIDLDAGTLTLRKDIIKTGPGRIIPLSSHLLDELATWGTREGWLIPSGRREGARARLARQRDLDRAWKRGGVREAVWKGRPFHAFRKAFKSNLLAAGATADAVDYLQGHSLGSGSSRGRYIDGAMLRLEETVAFIPRIGTMTNVVKLPRKATG